MNPGPGTDKASALPAVLYIFNPKSKFLLWRETFFSVPAIIWVSYVVVLRGGLSSGTQEAQGPLLVILRQAGKGGRVPRPLPGVQGPPGLPGEAGQLCVVIERLAECKVRA